MNFILNSGFWYNFSVYGLWMMLGGDSGWILIEFSSRIIIIYQASRRMRIEMVIYQNWRTIDLQLFHKFSFFLNDTNFPHHILIVSPKTKEASPMTNNTNYNLTLHQLADWNLCDQDAVTKIKSEFACRKDTIFPLSNLKLKSIIL